MLLTKKISLMYTLLPFLWYPSSLVSILPEIQQAIDENNIDQIRYLIEKKHDINHRGFPPVIALDEAVKQDREHIVTLLLNAGALVNYGTGSFSGGCPALFAHNNIRIISELLKAGASVDTRTAEGDTALMVAVRKNFERSIIGLYLHAGANVNMCNNAHETPISIAFKNQATHIVHFLLRWGAYLEKEKLDDPSLKPGVLKPALKGDLGALKKSLESQRLVPFHAHIISDFLSYGVGQGYDYIIQYLKENYFARIENESSTGIKTLHKILLHVKKDHPKYWNYHNCLILLEKRENYKKYVPLYTRFLKYTIWGLRKNWMPRDIIGVIVSKLFSVPQIFINEILDEYDISYAPLHNRETKLSSFK